MHSSVCSMGLHTSQHRCYDIAHDKAAMLGAAVGLSYTPGTDRQTHWAFL